MIYAVLCAPKTERVLLFMKSYMNYFDNCVYSFESKKSVISGEKLGITSTIASVMTGEKSVCDLHTINACPYTATDMSFDIRLDGEKIKVDRWRWLPTAILREGECDGFTAKTLATLIHNGRGAVLKVELLNKTEKEKRIPLAVMYRGVAKYLDNWNFCIPDPEKSLLEYYSEHDGVIGSSHNGISFLMTSSLSGMKYFHTAYLWENELTLPVGEPLTFYFSLHIGPDAECLAEAKATEADYEGAIERSFDYLMGEVDRIHNALPNFSSDDPELDAYYYRCLVTYILCRWDNPALCVVPYFSTGSMSGSCMCSYLWDWCGGLMMHPIYDAEVNRRQLRALLKNDLTKSYALNPITAGPTGPWYQVNQEKITLMVYHHVRATGDKEFLFEKINGKTVIDHMREQAYVCDDLSKPVTLYDYGKGKLEPRRPGWLGDDYIWYGEGNAHLELRRGIPYHGIMPDLNARRYLNYMRVYELTKVAGCPDEVLPKRAEALKEELKKLWNDDAKWYEFEVDGVRDLRYTVQMFKFLNSPVIDDKEREGLISHLNEREFLSKFGLHSMSKLDIAYDQDDIDNGGGGICTHFTNQICAQLYEMGYSALASDILRRILWWGTRLPYMGDSCAANMMQNRDDTPLQGDISSVSGAQMIFFYIFGIKPDFEGNITISPVPNRPTDKMTVENVRLWDKVFSVSVAGDSFCVTIDGKTLCAKIGESIKI